MASTGGYRATYRTRTYNSKGRVARTQPVPGMRHEQALLAEGATLVGGIDEVGVGAWAGPVAVGAVVRGACEAVPIAAASIVVKVARDRLMSALACMYPQYQFESNKGYPAPRHLWALSAYGPCPIHRRLYAPIRKLIVEGVPGRLLAEQGVAGGGAARPATQSPGER